MRTTAYIRVTNPIAFLILSLVMIFFLLGSAQASDDKLVLKELITEALQNSPEIKASESRAAASGYRIPQAKSLPDPMVMFGYQNEGFKKYTYGMEQGSQWMYSVSQTFPFPGKLSLKGDMASKDTESLRESYFSAKLRTILKVKELYYDLFLVYKNIDLVRERAVLFSKIEDAALARYSSGKASQQEVLMAQTEKYMLLEKEEMLRQKLQSIEAMLNAAIGRDVNSPLKQPEDFSSEPYHYNMNEVLKTALENSPEIKSREKMVESSETKVKMAGREYYPDFTVIGSYYDRKGQYPGMWSLSVTINVPIFYRTKQKQAVFESEALLSEARSEAEAVRLMISSAVRDNFSMLKTTESLIDLYKHGLIPKANQDVESAVSGYMTGRVDAITVITRLKSLIDMEVLYWGQMVEREKTIARLEAIAGIFNN